jgi:DNA polymerase-3 subunit epsilon
MLAKNSIWISFDTETSGKYPLESEICELAAVKWRDGEVIDKFESLIKVSKPMSNEVIAIHGITNEMLVNAPELKDVLQRFSLFIRDSVMVAHHAPFDLGFLAYAFEKIKIPLPNVSVFCTSLLSRTLFPDSPNHKMQTLIEYFNLPKGTAHRALYDSEACLQVLLKCLDKAGVDVTLEALEKRQRAQIRWQRFSIESLRTKAHLKALINACESQTDVQIVYQGGARPGSARTVRAIGVVRSLNGDFFVAQSPGEELAKRYYLDKITASQL